MRLYPGYLKQALLYSALFGLAMTINGCSFSESSSSGSGSSESSSDSSGSISDSTSSIVSSPSSVSGKSKKYQNEVADYTMAYVKSSQPNADYNSFLKGLSDIAAKRGITNWDQDSSTYKGIGKGLKKADVEGIAYETYKQNFAGNNAQKMQQIDDGYDAEK
ncbi:putative lipoprotein [Methylobacter psychrophilus]|uniref:putative lipoprotein n=1 Tax=Methylobacter psychrophilus TaxID=96941 RepID=UPI0021D4CCE9|nr:putative lipoprotein [Methylobacter psychrophilus]